MHEIAKEEALIFIGEVVIAARWRQHLSEGRCQRKLVVDRRAVLIIITGAVTMRSRQDGSRRSRSSRLRSHWR